MTSVELFDAAVNVVRNMPKKGPFNPSDDLKLKFYAYFKQATVGPNNTSKPSIFDVVNLYKWNAWKKLENMSVDEARQAYVDELKKVIEEMINSKDASQFQELLSPFCDLAHIQLPGCKNKKSASSSSSDQSFVGLDMVEQQSETTKKSTAAASSAHNCRDLSHSMNRFGDDLIHFSTNNHGCDDNEELGIYGRTVAQEINAQLALAVLRLQHGMECAVQRLNTIESRLKNPLIGDDDQYQRHSMSRQTNPKVLTSNKSRSTGRNEYPVTAFLLAWPFVVYFAMKLWERRRKS